MNLYPSSVSLTTLSCLLWLSSDFPTLYHAPVMVYSTTLHVFLSAQQQLQLPLRSPISLSTVPTNPSHTRMALHQNPHTALMYRLTPTTVFLIAPWFQPIFLPLACSAAKTQHIWLVTGVATACWCTTRQASSQPLSLARQAGGGDE